MHQWSRVLVGVLLGVAVVSAQRGGPPATIRDAPAVGSEQTGTYRLAGRVVDEGTGRPLHRVLVRLGTGGPQTDRWTLTDVDGSWAFENVAPGSYTVAVSRDGYVARAFGQSASYGAPATIAVPADESLDHLDIALSRGGVITGRITDEFGEAVAATLVQAMRIAFVNGQRQLVPVAPGVLALTHGGVTDDRGEYRIFGLAPGTYYLSAAYGQTAPGTSDDRVRYAMTYFPGSAAIAEAQAVTVSTDGPAIANFSLSPTALATVSGRVMNAQGQPVGASVVLRPVAPGHALQVGSPTSRALSAPGGAFTIRGVPAGDYMLEARTNPRAGAREVASRRIGISGQDVADVVLTTTVAGNVRGRLVAEGDSAGLAAGAFFLRAVPAGASGIDAMESGSMLARVSPGAPFAIDGILGRYLVRLERGPDGWWLKSVTIAGEDVTDAGFDVFGGETVTDVEVVMTQRMASLSGTVVDADGDRVSHYSVVAFSPDEATWEPYTRFIVSGTLGLDGSFSLQGLSRGDYLVVAVPPLQAGEETDPARLEQWRSVATRVTLADGEARSLNLTIAR